MEYVKDNADFCYFALNRTLPVAVPCSHLAHSIYPVITLLEDACDSSRSLFMWSEVDTRSW
jgi:hypothetical protein